MGYHPDSASGLDFYMRELERRDIDPLCIASYFLNARHIIRGINDPAVRAVLYMELESIRGVSDFLRTYGPDEFDDQEARFYGSQLEFHLRKVEEARERTAAIPHAATFMSILGSSGNREVQKRYLVRFFETPGFELVRDIVDRSLNPAWRALLPS